MPRGVYVRKHFRRKGPTKTATKSKAVVVGPKTEMVMNQQEIEEQQMLYSEKQPQGGYISEDTYFDLLQRFHLLQLELAERDVALARLQVEIAENKRNVIERANRAEIFLKRV